MIIPLQKIGSGIVRLMCLHLLNLISVCLPLWKAMHVVITNTYQSV